MKSLPRLDARMKRIGLAEGFPDRPRG